MLPISTSTLILGSEILSSSGNTLFINGIPLLTGYRFSGYNNTDGFISIDNVNYLLSFNRTGTNILQNNVAHSSLTSSIGIVLDDGYNGANAYQYFDKNNSTAPSMYNQIAFNGQPSVPAWVQYQFKTGSYVNQYGINPVISTNGRPPKTWDLSGSFDGSNWVLLDTHTNEFPFSDNVETKFSIASPDYYSYYRLVVKAHDSNTYYNAAQIREINFYDTIDRLPFWHEIRFLNSGNGLSVYAGKNETQIILNTLTGANGVTVTSNSGNLIIGYTGITGDVNAFHPYVNGSGLLNDWNISGQGGIQIYTSGNNLVFYSVGGGGGGGAISVNGGLAISGVTNFIQSGNLILVQNGNDVYVGSPTGNCITVNSGTPIQGLTNFRASGAAQVTQSGNDVIIGLPNTPTDSIRFGLSGYYLRQAKQITSNATMSFNSPNYTIFPLTGNFNSSILGNSLIDISIEGVLAAAGADIGFSIFRDGVNVFSGISNSLGLVRSNMTDKYASHPFSIQFLDTGYTGINPSYSLGVASLYNSLTAYVNRRSYANDYNSAVVINLKEYAYGPQFGIRLQSNPQTGYYLRQSKVIVTTNETYINTTNYTSAVSGQFDKSVLSGSLIKANVQAVYGGQYANAQFNVTLFRDNQNLFPYSPNSGLTIISDRNDNYNLSPLNLSACDTGITGGLSTYSFQVREAASNAIYIGRWFGGTMNNPTILTLEEYATGIIGGDTIILANSGTYQTPYDYTKLSDTKDGATPGGSATAGSWFTRTLNTVDTSGISGLILNTGNNTFYLPSGTYDIYGIVSALQVNQTAGRLFNIDLNTGVIQGTLAWTNAGATQASVNSHIIGRIVTSNTGNYYRLEQRVETTQGNTYALLPSAGTYSGVMSLVEIKRINPLYQGLILQNSTTNGGGTSNFFLNGVTGSGILTGVNGVNVTTTGNTITIDYTGAGGTLSFSGSGNLISVNGTLMPSGIIDFQGMGGAQLIPSGNTIFISGGAGGGSTAPVYRSYGWYTDQIYSGSTIGPVYRIEMDQNISGFFANTKGLADRNIFMDIKTSPTITGTWVSLFSGVTGQGIPVIPTSQQLSVSGVFIRSVITGNYYLRFDCYSFSTGNGLTAQLSCYY